MVVGNSMRASRLGIVVRLSAMSYGRGTENKSRWQRNIRPSGGVAARKT
jgi:hypothetical protein